MMNTFQISLSDLILIFNVTAEFNRSKLIIAGGVGGICFLRDNASFYLNKALDFENFRILIYATLLSENNY